jgi:hypothetical protein
VKATNMKYAYIIVSLKYFFPEEEADLIEQRIDCKGY